MLNLFDSHTHSDNSPDGEHSVTFLCEKAVAGGLMGFAVTDHCEIDKYREDSYQLRMIQSVFEVRKAQLYFGESLALTAGIELGQPLCDTETARRVLELHNYDMVLASVHAVRGAEDYYFTSFAGQSPQQADRLLGEYFEEVLQTVRWGGFDVLAHLTYPVRYIEERDGVPCDLTRHRAVIDEILRGLAKGGKGMELNTAGLYRGAGRTSPPPDLVARFRELGGELVTIGSDAHRAPDVGGGVARGMQLLRACGFERFAFYRKREPRLLELR